jgi:murein L,D-transpeptidase YafK
MTVFAIARMWGQKIGAGIAVAALAFTLSGCMSADLGDLGNPVPELSAPLLKDMRTKGMKPESPVLVRIFKEESTLEIWKQNASGKYALLKSYPMCRWSGKLGPKTRIGDRQAPEGFYHVSAGMLNPKSQFYLSFNLGYPNRVEAALGYTGEALMVHGACSSSGCYAMTDQAIGEIYAIVQKALKGGQTAFQVQAYPFRMTARNLADHRNDPNFAFWKTLKQGYDSFEVTRRQPKVSVCGRRYVFDTEFEGGEPAQPLAACPPAMTMPDAQIASMWERQDSEMAALLSSGETSHMTAYSDGGMHPSFRTLLQQNGAKQMAAKVSKSKYPISRPDAALADPFPGEATGKTPQ